LVLIENDLGLKAPNNDAPASQIVDYVSTNSTPHLEKAQFRSIFSKIVVTSCATTTSVASKLLFCTLFHGFLQTMVYNPHT